jgi:hypothetical protein
MAHEFSLLRWQVVFWPIEALDFISGTDTPIRCGNLEQSSNVLIRSWFKGHADALWKSGAVKWAVEHRICGTSPLQNNKTQAYTVRFTLAPNQEWLALIIYVLINKTVFVSTNSHLHIKLPKVRDTWHSCGHCRTMSDPARDTRGHIIDIIDNRTILENKTREY